METRWKVEKAKTSDKTWSFQHTFDFYDFLKKFLIFSHLFAKSVWPGYDEVAQEV